MNRHDSMTREYVWAGVWFVGLVALSLTQVGSAWSGWLFPIPITMVYCLASPGPAVVVAVLAGLALLVSGLRGLAVLFVAWMISLACILGEALSRRDSVYKAWVNATLSTLMLELAILASFGGRTADLFESLRGLWMRWLDNGHGVSIPGAGGGALVDAAIAWLQVMLPGVLVVLAFLLVVVYWGCTRYLLRRQRPAEGGFAHWRLPRSVVTVYLLALACVLLGVFSSLPLMGQFARNVVFLAGFFIGVQGLVCLTRGMAGGRLRALWLSLLVLLASVRLVSDFYVLVGILDVLRSPRGPKV
ncbi:DUF2232 domain-containing protein [Alicyclobacillus kakegawensis]|uniref:DUF2232 domain-containing protein n=1 Tax=Alicyclobacillus kakegawensis TaxID=392012 RepID=UPI0008331908|nr:DUF2232 domain-containing protein [Alicyclobacillus kakegawensis]